MINEVISLADIAVRTGLPLRTVRYCIDHRVLPLASPRLIGRGKLREYLPREGFTIAIAAYLLHTGIKRDLVTACIFETASKYGREYRLDEIPLYQAFVAGQSWLEIADGLYVRVHGTKWPGVSKAFDTDWMPLQKPVPKPDKQYTPIVLTKIDLTAIRKTLRV